VIPILEEFEVNEIPVTQVQILNLIMILGIM